MIGVAKNIAEFMTIMFIENENRELNCCINRKIPDTFQNTIR